MRRDAVSSNRYVLMFMRVWLSPSAGYKLGRCTYLLPDYTISHTIRPIFKLEKEIPIKIMNRFITGALYMNITHTAYGMSKVNKTSTVCSYKMVK